MKSYFLLCIVLLFQLTNYTFSQQNVSSKGTVQRVKVHGKSLVGNLVGDSSDRYVSIYLPPSYSKQNKRRYPVVYFLHGFTDSDAQWYGFKKHWINLPLILDSTFVNNEAAEMIFVTPDAYTTYQGSWYSNSITTGNWEQFIVEELVSYIDRHYRTLAKKESRGLAGHSMGGYGTMRIGQNNPETFSSIYLLSPATLLANASSYNSAFYNGLDTFKTIAQLTKADFRIKAAFATAAAWSPNPDKPPFYLDFPGGDENNKFKILNKWAANMPITTLDQHVVNLKKLKAIAFDAGNKDVSIAEGLKVLDRELNKYHIPHFYEEYQGDHLNRIGERIRKNVVPFFSKNLSTSLK